MFEKRLKEIETRKLEIRTMLEKGEGDLDEFDKEIRELDVESKDIEKRKTIAEGINAGKVEARKIEKPAAPEQRNFESMTTEELLASPEYRSAFLKRLQGKELTDIEQRALTTGTSSAGSAVPTTKLMGTVRNH